MQRMRRVSSVLALVGLLPAFFPLAPTLADPKADTVMVRVAAALVDPAVVSAVRVLDYGTFSWLELTAEQMGRLAATGAAFQRYDEATVLVLPGASFDTRQGEPTIEPHLRAPVGQVGFHLVQLFGPLRSDWLQALKDEGLTVVQYLAPFTYIVWGEPSQVEAVRGLPFVRWTGAYHPAYKIAPQVRNPAQEIRGYSLVLCPEGLEESLAQILSWGGSVLARYPSPFGSLEMTRVDVAIGPEHLEELACLPNLYAVGVVPVQGSIRDEMGDQIVAENHPGGVPQPGYLAWLAGKGLNGAGVTVAIVDTGTDYSHTDLGAGRTVACLDYVPGTSPPPACSGINWCGSHGTMTAGIAVGDGESGVTDLNGFLYGLGMAPESNLIVQNFLCSTGGGGTPPREGWRQLSRDTVAAGGYVQGNSWGPSGLPQGYDADTREFDFMPRDADPWTAGNQPMVFSLSIMNGNGGISSQGTPDEGKNLLRVGASKNFRAGDIDDLCTCTAHGPALDGRLLPDIVAPGQVVYSTVPYNGHSSGTGTSFASPHASGAAALFVQWYDGQFGVFPSPALVKAAFVNGADDLYGGRDADGYPMGHIPNNQQGWGRLNLERVLEYSTSILYFDQDDLFTETGQSWTWHVTPADPAKPLKVTLAWTDAPGPGLGGSSPAWVNDLDLVVSQEGTTWLGNVFAGGWSTAGGSADYRNNLENVFLENPGGVYQITVLAANIAGDGVPANGDATDQDFALVCWNCVRKPDFTLTADPDELEVCAPVVVTSTLEVGQVLTYSEAVTLEVLGVPAGVTATVEPVVVMPPGEAKLTLEVGPGAVDGAYRLVVSGTAELTNVHVVEVGLGVSAGLPAAPILLGPADGTVGVASEGLTFTWGMLPHVEAYSLEVDVRSDLSAPVVQVEGIGGEQYTMEVELAEGTCYSWRVRGKNTCGVGEWAVPYRFATAGWEWGLKDDMESGAAQWGHQAAQGNDGWTIQVGQYHSPIRAWRVPDAAVVTDSWLWNVTPVAVRDGSVLRFWHRYNFDSSDDGAVLEVSADGGTSWVDLGPAIVSNGYNGTISTPGGNPLGGRAGWVGDQWSWKQVEVDLGGYVGESVQVRWRIGCDDGIGDQGWYIDDVEIVAPIPPGPTVVVEGVQPESGTSYTEQVVEIGGSGFVGHPSVRLDGTWLEGVTVVTSGTVEAVVPAGMPEGVYTLTLVNGDCQEAIAQRAYTVTGECRIPGVWVGSDSPVELGGGVHMVGVITGTGEVSYSWDFGGAGFGVGMATLRPVYTYTAPGEYTVTLTAEDVCGRGKGAGRVEVWCAQPGAGYVSNSPVELGEGMVFTAALTGTGPLTYSWDFGGVGVGVGLDTLRPVYTYTAPGEYLVTLRVGGPCGTAVSTGTVMVEPIWHVIYLPVVLKGGPSSSLGERSLFADLRKPVESSLWSWYNGATGG